MNRKSSEAGGGGAGGRSGEGMGRGVSKKRVRRKEEKPMAEDKLETNP